MEQGFLSLDFTSRGYILMACIWGIAGLFGGVLAYHQKRNAPFWFIVCLLVPMALFFLAGRHARIEDRKTKKEKLEQAPDTPNDAS